LDKFKKLSAAAPHIECPCIVTKEGILLSHLSDEHFAIVDLAATISALQTAAVHFSSVLALTGCPHIRIMGENHSFYLYQLNKKFLFAFFSSENRNSPYGIDASNTLEDNRVSQLVEELKTCVQQIS
jgi:predicted regulator of Ras-like GTPase activity (Roadblock/LC7/MglB family)